MVRHVLLVSLAAVGTGCFSKPSAPASSDASNDAQPMADAAGDASILCAQGKTPLPSDMRFPRRNALAVGDITDDDIDDLAIFGETPTQQQRIYIYFGALQRPINFACADLVIDASTMTVIGAVRLAPRYPVNGQGALMFVGLVPGGAAMNVELDYITLTQGVPETPIKVIASGSQGTPRWTDTSVYNSAFIADRIYNGNREVLFGGNLNVFTAQFNIGHEPNTNASRVVVTPTSTDSIYEIVERPPGPTESGLLSVITGKEIYDIQKLTPEAMDLTSPPANGGAGAPMGLVWASHEYSQVRGDYPVFGLRVPSFSNGEFPMQPSFQLVINDGRAQKRTLNQSATAPTGPYLTDAVVAKYFGDNGVSFFGILSKGAGSSSIQNVLWLTGGNWNPQATDLMDQTQTVPLRDNDMPLLAVGWFQTNNGRKNNSPGDQQVLVFYPKNPTLSQCFKPKGGGGFLPC